MSTDRKNRSSSRRGFLGTAAGGLITAKALAQAQRPIEGQTRDELRRDMMAGIEDDVKHDLDVRSHAVEELPEPKNIRPGGMLDARFPVYYKTSVPEAMRLVTDYFAAFNDRDLAAVARTLHFPYATYEGTEPLIYKTAEEFLNNPPPSIHESGAPDSQLRRSSYDIMDVLQLQTFNAVNVGLELCYTRYRADGYPIGINQGIYAITNNDGKWGIQLSSVIFTPTEYIGQPYRDAVEAHLRQGRSSMAAFGDHDYDILTGRRGGPDGQPGGRGGRGGRGNGASARKTASITGAPGATSFFLSAWAGKPMEPYNSKGRKSRLAVSGPGVDPAINQLSAGNYEIAQLDRAIQPTNIVTSKGQPGWFYEMAGGGIGHYGYTMTLDDSKVLHAGPEKAHALGGYIRYTPDNIFISETRSLGIMVYDKRLGTWGTGGGLGQSIRRDRTNDPQS